MTKDEEVLRAKAVYDGVRWVVKALEPAIEKAVDKIKLEGIGTARIPRGMVGRKPIISKQGSQFYLLLPKPVIAIGPRGGYITGYRGGEPEYGGYYVQNVGRPGQWSGGLVEVARKADKDFVEAVRTAFVRGWSRMVVELLKGLAARAGGNPERLQTTAADLERTGVKLPKRAVQGRMPVIIKQGESIDVLVPKPAIAIGPRGGYITGYHAGKPEYGGYLISKVHTASKVRDLESLQDPKTANRELLTDIADAYLSAVGALNKLVASLGGRFARLNRYEPDYSKVTFLVFDRDTGKLAPMKFPNVRKILEESVARGNKEDWKDLLNVYGTEVTRLIAETATEVERWGEELVKRDPDGWAKKWASDFRAEFNNRLAKKLEEAHIPLDNPEVSAYLSEITRTIRPVTSLLGDAFFRLSRYAEDLRKAKAQGAVKGFDSLERR
jgi:hypothetical protein